MRVGEPRAGTRLGRLFFLVLPPAPLFSSCPSSGSSSLFLPPPPPNSSDLSFKRATRKAHSFHSSEPPSSTEAMASASSSAQAAFGLGRRKKNPGLLDQIGKFFGGDKKRKSKVRREGGPLLNHRLVFCFVFSPNVSQNICVFLFFSFGLTVFLLSKTDPMMLCN